MSCSHLRNFCSFRLLVDCNPALRTLITPDFSWQEKSEALTYLNQIEKKGNAARSDDVGRMKEDVATFLNQMYNPSTAFITRNRDQQGLQGTITGCLLCPIHFDWSDDKYVDSSAQIIFLTHSYSTRAHVCAGDTSLKPKLTKNFFLHALYPRNHELGAHSLDYLFLRSTLLVRVSKLSINLMNNISLHSVDVLLHFHRPILRRHLST